MIGESYQHEASQTSQVVTMVIVVTLDTAIQDLDMDILAIPDMDIQGTQVMVILVKNHFQTKLASNFHIDNHIFNRSIIRHF